MSSSSTASSVPKSPNRLPAPRSVRPSTLNKPTKSAATLPRSISAPSSPRGPTIPSKPDAYAKSPSKIRNSPSLKSPAAGTVGASRASSAPVPDATSTGSGNTANRSSSQPIATKSPKTPLPRITVTPSPPPAPTKPSTHLVDAAKQIAQLVKPLELVPKQGSPYIAAHLGDPCTSQALDHVLECGHKVITTNPELCASNCKGSFSAHANPKGLDQKFACLACIVGVQQTKHAEKVRSFKEELKQVARSTKKPNPEQWIEAKVGFMQQAWADLESEEMVAEAKAGRYCYPVYVQPEIEGAVLAVVGESLREKGRTQIEASQKLTKQ